MCLCVPGFSGRNCEQGKSISSNATLMELYTQQYCYLVNSSIFLINYIFHSSAYYEQNLTFRKSIIIARSLKLRNKLIPDSGSRTFSGFYSSVIKDIPDSCLHDNGHCEHFCTEEDGQRNCSCVDGYFLGSNGQNCLPIGENITKHIDNCESGESQLGTIIHHQYRQNMCLPFYVVR